MNRSAGKKWIPTMPTTASLRAILPVLALALTAGAALAEAAQDCKDATLTSEERQTACAAAASEAAALVSQAETYLRSDRPEDALVAARRSVEIAGYLTFDSPEEAQAAADRMVDLGPRYEKAQGWLLQAMVETGAADEAIAAYREAQAAGVEDEAGYLFNGLAWGLYRTGEHDKALPIVEEWLAAHPEPTAEPQYHYTLDTAAHIMAAAGQADEALDIFLRAAEIGGPGFRAEYEAFLTGLGFAPEPGKEGFETALRACVATREACKLAPAEEL
jgi:tetratricopeptide (TPR) repeat protein